MLCMSMVGEYKIIRLCSRAIQLLYWVLVVRLVALPSLWSMQDIEQLVILNRHLERAQSLAADLQ